MIDKSSTFVFGKTALQITSFAYNLQGEMFPKATHSLDRLALIILGATSTKTCQNVACTRNQTLNKN